MRLSILLFLLFLSSQTQAVDFVLFPIANETRYQRNQDQQMMLRPYSALAAGVDVENFSIFFERAFYEETYGSSPLQTTHQQTSYALLGRYLLFENRGEEKVTFQILPGIGFGLHQDKSITRLYGSESSSVSGWEPLATAGVVARGRFHFLVLEVEGRVFSGKLLDPTFSTGGVLRLGFIY